MAVARSSRKCYHLTSFCGRIAPCCWSWFRSTPNGRYVAAYSTSFRRIGHGHACHGCRVVVVWTPRASSFRHQDVRSDRGRSASGDRGGGGGLQAGAGCPELHPAQDAVGRSRYQRLLPGCDVHAVAASGPTEEEAIAELTRVIIADAKVDPKDVHYDWKEYGMDGWQSPIRPSLRTSLIVDPEDGRLPSLTPEAQKRRADRAAAARVRNPEVGVRTLPSFYTRCIMGNAGGGPLVRGGNPDPVSTVGS